MRPSTYTYSSSTSSRWWRRQHCKRGSGSWRQALRQGLCQQQQAPLRG